MQIYSPILLTISSNPENAWCSFEIMKKIKPPHLYIFARPINEDQKSFVANEVIKMVDQVNWPCKVEKNISTRENDSPLEWFFSIANEGIIIQDTCVPDASFVYFAQAMLERYRAKKEILVINGYNGAESWRSKHSYFFSHIGVAGGWASWKRSWDSNKDKLRALFEQNFQDWSQSNLMSIVPKNNLIDLSPGKLSPLVSQKSAPLAFPLEHQILFPIETAYDKFLREKFDNKLKSTS